MVEETVERGEDSRWVASYLSCKYLTEKPAPARRQSLWTSSRSCSLVPSRRARHTSFAILACLTVSATVENEDGAVMSSSTAQSSSCNDDGVGVGVGDEEENFEAAPTFALRF